MRELIRYARDFMEKSSQWIYGDPNKQEEKNTDTAVDGDDPNNLVNTGNEANPNTPKNQAPATPPINQEDPQARIVNPLDPSKAMPGADVLRRAQKQKMQNNMAFGKIVPQNTYGRQNLRGDGGAVTNIGADPLTVEEMNTNIMSGNGVGIAQNIDLVKKHRKGLQSWENRTVDQFLNKNTLGNAGKADMERDDKRLI